MEAAVPSTTSDLAARTVTAASHAAGHDLPGTEARTVRISKPRLPGQQRPQRLDRLRNERGSITLMLVILFPMLLALAGLVLDGGAKLRATEHATAIAQEAARAGAGAVNQSAAYATGAFTVSPVQAVAAARAYLAHYSYPATVTVTGQDTISVRVTITQPTAVMSIVGIRAMTVAGRATARLVTSVPAASGRPGNPEGPASPATGGG
jgi:Flp pilus assembly protein TadG